MDGSRIGRAAIPLLFRLSIVYVIIVIIPITIGVRRRTQRQMNVSRATGLRTLVGLFCLLNSLASMVVLLIMQSEFAATTATTEADEDHDTLLSSSSGERLTAAPGLSPRRHSH